MSRRGNVQPRVSVPPVVSVAAGRPDDLSAPLVDINSLMTAKNLPDRDERGKIIERARQQLQEAKVIAEYVNRLEMENACRGPRISFHILAPVAQAA
jgi:hypothetical protein